VICFLGSSSDTKSGRRAGIEKDGPTAEAAAVAVENLERARTRLNSSSWCFERLRVRRPTKGGGKNGALLSPANAGPKPVKAGNSKQLFGSSMPTGANGSN
jgi:hypothetical protein